MSKIKTALNKIAQMSDCGTPEATIVRMKEIAVEALKEHPTSIKQYNMDYPHFEKFDLNKQPSLPIEEIEPDFIGGKKDVDEICREVDGTSYYQPLFNLMCDEHDLKLLDSEMNDIIYVVNKMQEPDYRAEADRIYYPESEISHIQIAAHIKAREMGDGRLSELIEWINEKRNVDNFQHFDQVVKKANELLNKKP